MDYYIINKLQQAEQSFIFKSIKLFINIRELSDNEEEIIRRTLIYI